MIRTIIIVCVVCVGLIGVKVDGGLFFNRQRCTPEGCDPLPSVDIPIEELILDVPDKRDPALGGVDHEGELDRLAHRVTELERLVAGGWTVVFEGGDDESEAARTVQVLMGGRLVIPAQVLRIRTVDRYGNSVGEPVTDVAPLGSPLKVRNVLK